jgi:hypothetical protein
MSTQAARPARLGVTNLPPHLERQVTDLVSNLFSLIGIETPESTDVPLVSAPHSYEGPKDPDLHPPCTADGYEKPNNTT